MGGAGNNYSRPGFLEDFPMLANLLIYRLVTVNIVAAALALWAYANGLVLAIFVNDVSHLSYAIIVLFLLGLVSTFIRAGKVCGAVNSLKRGCARCYLRRRAAKMAGKNNHIEAVAGWLVTLGLLGTVAGFSIAISGIDLDSLASAAGVQKSAAQLLSGLHVAIGTTLLGGFLGMLTEVNYVMLRNATSAHVHDVAPE